MNLNAELDAAAEVHSGKVALVFAAGETGAEQAWSFRELREKILRAAAAFRSAGIAAGDKVALLHRNDPAFIVAYFGLIRIGAVAVPINFMIQSPEELRFMLGHCGARGVVTQSDLLPGLLRAREALPELEHLWVSDAKTPDGTAGFWDSVGASVPLEETVAAAPDDVVAIVYSSGTTGVPKGVMMTHANLVSNCRSTIKTFRFSQDDVFLALLPMFHTFCWMVDVIIPLSLGAKIVNAVSVAPPKPWLEALGRHGVTVLAAVPPVWVLLSKSASAQELIRAGGLFRSLRVLISGAAPLSKQTLADIKAVYGLDITEGYGLTETSPVATVNPLGAPRPGSIGKPIDGVEVRIAGEDGRELPTGAEGEIEIRGPNIMKGYFKDEAATRAAVTSAGWFKSGDIGARDEDGYFHIRDRKKDMIIVKGLKVFSAQVEKVLLGHPAVQDAAVIGIPDGEGSERIKAFLVLAEGASATVPEFHAFCRERLDAYKRPREIELLAELPKNALKKTLKRELREREMVKARKGAAA